jgi:hypothetical protein
LRAAAAWLSKALFFSRTYNNELYLTFLYNINRLFFTGSMIRTFQDTCTGLYGVIAEILLEKEECQYRHPRRHHPQVRQLQLALSDQLNLVQST